MPPLAPNLGEWVGRLKGAVKAATGREPNVVGVPYGTDAGPLARWACRAWFSAPETLPQAHTKDEWIELDQVRQAAEAYYQIARDLG